MAESSRHISKFIANRVATVPIRWRVEKTPSQLRQRWTSMLWTMRRFNILRGCRKCWSNTRLGKRFPKELLELERRHPKELLGLGERLPMEPQELRTLTLKTKASWKMRSPQKRHHKMWTRSLYRLSRGSKRNMRTMLSLEMPRPYMKKSW